MPYLAEKVVDMLYNILEQLLDEDDLKTADTDLETELGKSIVHTHTHSHKL
jgi:hypothetical protein